MPAETIYHICTQESWNNQLDQSNYKTESLETEGFIHASTAEQVPLVLKRYYKGVKNLLKLQIKATRVIPEIIYEEAPSGGMYPHIYGALNKTAISDIKSIE